MATLGPRPRSDPRGKPTVYVRRAISDIIDVLESRSRQVDAPSPYVLRTLMAGPPAEVLTDFSTLKTHHCGSAGKGGTPAQTIARVRGGRTTKVIILADRLCRPTAFVPGCGQVADCRDVDTLLDLSPAARLLRREKAYDSDALRGTIERMCGSLTEFRRLAT